MNRTKWRVLGSIFGGVLVGLLLFLFTGNLIDGGQGRNGAAAAGQIVGLIRIQEEEPVIVKPPRRPRKPEPVKGPPMPAALEPAEQLNLHPGEVRIGVPDIEPGNIVGGPSYIGIGQPVGMPGDSDAVTVVRIDPDYPRQALIDGVEGYVKLKVLIGTDGSVLDVEIIEAEPGRVFVRNAERAVRRWKFRPRVVDGVAEERWAVTSVMFELDE